MWDFSHPRLTYVLGQGFLFLYRGRAEMLCVLSVLSLGNTQWDAPTWQLLIPVRCAPGFSPVERRLRQTRTSPRARDKRTHWADN